MLYRQCRAGLLVVLAVAAASSASAQTSIPPEYRGSQSADARGVLDGNLIGTNFRNHGELSSFSDQPWGVYPRPLGGSHVDGIGFVAAGQVRGERVKWGLGARDTVLNPVIINYRDAGKRISPFGTLWGWLPLTGFHNPNRFSPVTGARATTPAVSTDRTSWSAFWPDRLDDATDPGWPGQWNGLGGRSRYVADQESYYVMDDFSDQEYLVDTVSGRPFSAAGVFYPDPNDSTKGGLGLRVAVRTLQWGGAWGEDFMILHYRITNAGAYQHDRLYFAELVDYGLGLESGDEKVAYDPQEEVIYGWDLNGMGYYPTGGTYKLYYTGFALVESPSNSHDGLDNDGDGITDESISFGPGVRIEGQDAIRSYVEANYDMGRFEAAYGPLGERPAFRRGIWWTGDEDLDWVASTDVDGNGQLSEGDVLSDDVGADGWSPYDPGAAYVGPDFGEADGVPTPGETNFDGADADEGDEVGLTGADLGSRAVYEQSNTMNNDSWLWAKISASQFSNSPPQTSSLQGVDPFVQLSAGPAGLLPGESTDFVVAWVFGDGLTDFLQNMYTAGTVRRANYRPASFVAPPALGAERDSAGVKLSWNGGAFCSASTPLEGSFEGFKLLRGTDATDYGSLEQIGQWDLRNGVAGTLPGLGGPFLLGADTGFDAIWAGATCSFTFKDTTALADQQYMYVVLAYNHGKLNQDSTAFIEFPAESPYQRPRAYADQIIGLGNVVVVDRFVPSATEAGQVPVETAFLPARPNPFSRQVTLQFQLARPSFTTLRVYDLVGRLVATLVDEQMASGSHTRVWQSGALPSGLYFCRLQTDGRTLTQKLVLVR